MFFWCAVLYIGIGVSYMFGTDHSYFWFASASQAQEAIVACCLYKSVRYSDTKRKAVCLVLLCWVSTLAILDWSSIVSIWTMTTVFIGLIAFGVRGIVKIIAIQGKQKAD